MFQLVSLVGVLEGEGMSYYSFVPSSEGFRWSGEDILEVFVMDGFGGVFGDIFGWC